MVAPVADWLGIPKAGVGLALVAALVTDLLGIPVAGRSKTHKRSNGCEYIYIFI